MKILFLIGAGVSQGAGMIGTQDLDNNIRTGENIYRHTDGKYYFANNLEDCYKVSDYIRIAVINLINFITNKLVDSHLQIKINYEYLYYYLNELNLHFSSEKNNLFVDVFFKLNKIDINKLSEVTDRSGINKIELNYLFQEAVNYMRDATNYLLNYYQSNLTSKLNHLNLIKDVNSLKNVENIYLVTTNYDNLIEKYFEQNNISLYNNFTKLNEEVSKFEFDIKNTIKNKISLIKIHGSLNLYRLRKANSLWESEFYGETNNINYEININEEYYHVPQTYPIIMLGVSNKDSEYTRGYYFKVFIAFNECLENSNIVIVAGYSFLDSGINTRIIEWVYNNYKKNKLIVINPDIRNLIDNEMSGNIWNKLQMWQRDGVIHFIESKFENVSLEEIEKIINL